MRDRGLDIPSGALLGWMGVPGYLAIVVERAVDGTNIWSVAGTSRASAGLFGGAGVGSSRPSWNTFLDISGGIVPRTTYVYKVTAIGVPGTGAGPANQVWWNSVKWTAPDLIAPEWISTAVTSTGSLHVNWRLDSPGNPFMPQQPWTYTISAPTGWSKPSGGSTASCAGVNGCSWDFPSPPSGTHVFTLTARWQALVNGAIQTVATSQADKSLVIP